MTDDSISSTAGGLIAITLTGMMTTPLVTMAILAVIALDTESQEIF